MKTIVAHLSVDLDAITSAWLIKRFMPGWSEAQFQFVPAGTTLNNEDPDKNPEIIHVDTGLGKFDHHQIEDRALCAAKRVFDYLIEKGHIKENDKEALSKIVNYVVMDDNFQDVFLNDPASDLYDFGLLRLVDGIKTIKSSDRERIEFVFNLLDAELEVFKSKLRAQAEIKQGLIFQSKWGKGLAIESSNPGVEKLAMKMEYEIVVRKDSAQKGLRIKTLPKKELDLTPIYEQLTKEDPKATWFLHVSKNMLLNGTSKNPNMVPTKLPLKRVIEIIKSI